MEMDYKKMLMRLIIWLALSRIAKNPEVDELCFWTLRFHKHCHFHLQSPIVDLTALAPRRYLPLCTKSLLRITLVFHRTVRMPPTVTGWISTRSTLHPELLPHLLCCFSLPSCIFSSSSNLEGSSFFFHQVKPWPPCSGWWVVSSCKHKILISRLL